MTVNGLLAKGAPPNLPAFVLPLRIAIVVLSVVVLALAAFAISVFGSYASYAGGYTGVSGLLIFVVVKTWIVFGVLAFLEYRMPHLYYRLVALVLYALSLVFWLSAWAWAASIAAFWLGTVCEFGVCVGADSYAKKEGGALAACAGLGAVAWVLSIVNLFLFVRACLTDTVGPAQAELGQVPLKEANATVVPMPGPAPGQQQYAPYPAQYPAPYQQQQPVQGYPQQTY
ncbi:hypothetical protein SPI_07331 [Niveomyces insectorum RCEF 264]|uniref:MARVEL domain-containing protein n=1 Tax=Niveomyces insectorum RCEF 264 TaxID=1081102 RepID=A0A167PRL1_9HYPO|nr:hypothetical protein SPI_07331 [Niveomyces insectorum RCEF 264]